MKIYTYLLALPLLTFGLLLSGCDSGGSNGNEVELVNGTWEGISPDAVPFLYIDLPTLEEYEYRDERECYVVDRSTLERISDDTFEVTPENGGKPYTVTLRVENDILTVSQEDGIVRFSRSNADVSAFSTCD